MIHVSGHGDTLHIRDRHPPDPFSGVIPGAEVMPHGNQGNQCGCWWGRGVVVAQALSVVGCMTSLYYFFFSPSGHQNRVHWLRHPTPNFIQLDLSLTRVSYCIYSLWLSTLDGRMSAWSFRTMREIYEGNLICSNSPKSTYTHGWEIQQARVRSWSPIDAGPTGQVIDPFVLFLT